MKNSKVKSVFVFFFVIAAACILYGQKSVATEMIYSPINPSFGGSPLNGSYLLGRASAQNSFQEEEKSALEDFEEQLSRRIISELSRKITQDAFGEEGLATGLYTIGDFSIDVDTGSGDGIIVEIRDFSTGGETIIEIPSY